MSDENKPVGLKFDQNKAPIDLLPPEALFAIARVMQFGAKKYARANWANGIEYSRLIAAALRHILLFNQGQDMDEEVKESHIACAATNLLFLLWHIENRSDKDDRWIKSVK